MKTAIKLALVAAAFAAGAANATVVDPSQSGGGDLVLYVTGYSGATANAFYVYDTGITLNSIYTAAQIATDTTNKGASFVDTTSLTGPSSITTGATSTSLSSFLTAHSTDTFQWALMAGDSSAQSGLAATLYQAGKQRFLTSSNLYSTSTGIAQSNVKTSLGSSGLLGFAAAINADTTNRVGFGDSATGAQAPIGFSTNVTTGAALGGTQNLYLFAATGGSVGTTFANVYKSVQSYTLSTTGVLTASGGGTTVPVPGAVWLLGSGLLGLVGVSRRRAV